MNGNDYCNENENEDNEFGFEEEENEEENNNTNLFEGKDIIYCIWKNPSQEEHDDIDFNVLLIPKKYWEENGVQYDQHITVVTKGINLESLGFIDECECDYSFSPLAGAEIYRQSLRGDVYDWDLINEKIEKDKKESTEERLEKCESALEKMEITFSQEFHNYIYKFHNE